MATFRPGQVIRFTYRHFWPKDANSRPPEKEILVLHTHWEGKVHGIDMKALTGEQMETLKAVLDPRNNRDREQTQDVGDDYKTKIRKSGQNELEVLQNTLKGLEKKMSLIRAQAAVQKMSVSIDVMKDYNIRKQELKRQITEFDVANATSDTEDPKQLAMKPLTPRAKQILQRMKPGKLVNNPRVFYNMVIKPIIGRTDAYRTFFPGRMDAVQVDPRWSWSSGAGNVESPQQGIARNEKQAQAPKKMAGAPRPETPDEAARRNAFMGKFQKPSAPQAPVTPGVKPMSPGVMKSGVVGTNIPTKMPKITKPAKPR